jgi:NAD(P)H dehydrogenase (quinone)
MNILIVHAHHEPNSFSSALKDRAVATLTKLGHHVEVSDLYAMGFNPVSDRRNFTMVANPAYLKQQREETYAAEHDGFAPELVAEMEKVLHADLLIFNFPLWWFGMPAALKGWVDRVFAYGKMYGAGSFTKTASDAEARARHDDDGQR